ncbi:NPCBM/NEW2 domain-containing protein [Labrys sp. 22185]|uniref:NPCBM/NEW2 domain-containing protein n=1 Tax=Labrys sp. 22185 TaxID=3453888 RepID=UPI003F84D91F
MGYNAWNTFRCNVGKDLITGAADELVRQGLDKVGFEYVNLDDCWMGGRDRKGVLYSNQGPEQRPGITNPIQKFPDETDSAGNKIPGIKAVGNYIRSKGLKFGIYSSPINTCAAYWDNYPLGNGVGSSGKEDTDIATFISWGVSYLKYDRCNAGETGSGWNKSPSSAVIYPYFLAMRDAIGRSNSNMFYSTNLDFNGNGLAHWNGSNPPLFTNTSRVAADISDFNSVIAQINAADQLKGFAVPGYWNDMDMMQVGNLPGDNLNRINMGMWAIMNSPMLIGSDIRNMDQKNPTALEILRNEEVIAFNKDPLNTQAVVVKVSGNTQVWAKPLFARGERAVALLNKSTSPTSMTVRWSDLHLAAGEGKVRDVWSRTDKGAYTDSYSVTVPGRDVVMLKITGAEIPLTGTKVLTATDILYKANSYNDVRTDISGDGKKLALNGVAYDQGFGTDAPSQMQFRLDGACSKFTAKVGIDDQIIRQQPASNGFGQVVFQVWGDGRILAETDVMNRQQSADLQADVTGVTVLRLIARLGNNRDNAQYYAYADWITPTVTCQ